MTTGSFACECWSPHYAIFDKADPRDPTCTRVALFYRLRAAVQHLAPLLVTAGLQFRPDPESPTPAELAVLREAYRSTVACGVSTPLADFDPQLVQALVATGWLQMLDGGYIISPMGRLIVESLQPDGEAVDVRGICR